MPSVPPVGPMEQLPSYEQLSPRGHRGRWTWTRTSDTGQQLLQAASQATTTGAVAPRSNNACQVKALVANCRSSPGSPVRRASPRVAPSASTTSPVGYNAVAGMDNTAVGYNASVTTGSTMMGPAIQTIWSKEILFQSMPVLRFEQFAVKKTELGTMPGLTVNFMRYNNLPIPNGPLLEGVRMKTHAISANQYAITVAEQGFAVAVSELLLNASFDDVMASASRLLGPQHGAVHGRPGSGHAGPLDVGRVRLPEADGDQRRLRRLRAGHRRPADVAAGHRRCGHPGQLVPPPPALGQGRRRGARQQERASPR